MNRIVDGIRASNRAARNADILPLSESRVPIRGSQSQMSQAGTQAQVNDPREADLSDSVRIWLQGLDPEDKEEFFRMRGLSNSDSATTTNMEAKVPQNDAGDDIQSRISPDWNLSLIHI